MYSFGNPAARKQAVAAALAASQSMIDRTRGRVVADATRQAAELTTALAPRQVLPAGIESSIGKPGSASAAAQAGHFPGDGHNHAANGISEAALLKAVNRMIADSGGKAKINSRRRSTKRQAQLWEAALKKYGSPEKARKWVAPPGKSKHEHGLAIDLGYADAATRKWFHDNAARYGLEFPLSNEPWHVEIKGSRKKKK